MLKKTITYTDFDGNDRTEDFYFNLTKAEILEWETSRSGGMTKLLERISQEKNVPELMKTFKLVVTKSFGTKSDDGKHFRKRPEDLEDFMATEAYSALIMELLDAQTAIDFIKGIVPADMREQVSEDVAAGMLNEVMARG